MVVTQHLETNFYAKLRKQHVLLLTARDVDAVCSCKILQALLKADNVQHTIVPVSGTQDLLSVFSDYSAKVNVVVMINCGGTVSLLPLLEPHQDMVIFVLDSHRPLELDNVYNQDQVFVVLWANEDLSFPDYDEIYGSDVENLSGEEESTNLSDSDKKGEPDEKRIRAEAPYQQRRKQHLWKKRREEALFKYNQFCYHGTAASVVMIQLAQDMTRCTNEMIWWAVIGLTEQYIHEKVNREKYIADVHFIQPEVMRLNQSDPTSSAAVNCLRIMYERELRLVLYRHWTVYDSLCHTDYTSCRFKVWTTKGQKKLLEFLADMGLPLLESKQKFSAMDVQIKEKFKEWMIESGRKFGLEDMTYSSYTAQLGYRHCFSAADMVYCLTALLEGSGRHSDGFHPAFDALTIGNMPIIFGALELAKQQQIAIVSQVRSIVEMHQAVCAGPFIYAFLDEGEEVAKHFYMPITLGKLARYLRETWITTSKRSRELAFILCSPQDSTIGKCLVVGVPAHIEDTRRSEFHQAFMLAAERIQASAVFMQFSKEVVEIPAEDKGRFIDALSALSLR